MSEATVSRTPPHLEQVYSAESTILLPDFGFGIASAEGYARGATEEPRPPVPTYWLQFEEIAVHAP
jgi:hypothetical protein